MKLAVFISVIQQHFVKYSVLAVVFETTNFRPGAVACRKLVLACLAITKLKKTHAGVTSYEGESIVFLAFALNCPLKSDP